MSASRGPGSAWGHVLGLLAGRGAATRLSILIFHRVQRDADPLFPDEIDAPRFESLCAWLAANYNVLPLDEAIRRRVAGSLPSRALAITFDDGYADNHDVALPILLRHGLTATFFIATGFLGGGRMWNDTVVEAIRRTGAESLDVSRLGLPGLSRLDLRDIVARRRAMHAVLNAAKYLAPAERLGCVQRLADVAGAPLPDDLMMSPAQVAAMAAAGMQIGAHTVNHPILARVDEAVAHEEMARSKFDLESMTGAPVSLFAYPNGRAGRDYGPRDVALARGCGFEAAVSTNPGASRAGDGLDHELPRFTPWDTQRWRFALRLARNLYTPVTRA